VIVPIKARHLLSSPNSEHLRAAFQDSLHSIPVNLIEKSRGEDISAMVIITSLFIAPSPRDRSFIIPSKFSTSEHDYQILPRKDARDVTVGLKTRNEGRVGKFVTGTVKLFFRCEIFVG
jgi:hypothetical protein